MQEIKMKNVAHKARRHSDSININKITSVRKLQALYQESKPVLSALGPGIQIEAGWPAQQQAALVSPADGPRRLIDQEGGYIQYVYYTNYRSGKKATLIKFKSKQDIAFVPFPTPSSVVVSSRLCDFSGSGSWK